MINTQRFVERMGSLRGNMHGCCQHAANGQSKPGLSRREIISQKMEAGKAEKRAARFERLRTSFFPSKTQRIAAVKRIGKFIFRPVVGFNGRTLSDVTRGEMEIALRCAGFTGYRFTDGARRFLFQAN